MTRQFMDRILTLLGMKQRWIEHHDDDDLIRRELGFVVEAVELLLLLEMERAAQKDNVDMDGDFIGDVKTCALELWDEQTKDQESTKQ